MNSNFLNNIPHFYVVVLAEAAMKDYDVNPGEWDEQGNPKAPQSQLKHMW